MTSKCLHCLMEVCCIFDKNCGEMMVTEVTVFFVFWCFFPVVNELY